MGGCGGTRRHCIHILSHVAQDVTHPWFGAFCTDLRRFWPILGHFLGHIVELEAMKSLFDMRRTRRLRYM